MSRVFDKHIDVNRYVGYPMCLKTADSCTLHEEPDLISITDSDVDNSAFFCLICLIVYQVIGNVDRLRTLIIKLTWTRISRHGRQVSVFLWRCYICFVPKINNKSFLLKPICHLTSESTLITSILKTPKHTHTHTFWQ